MYKLEVYMKTNDFVLFTQYFKTFQQAKDYAESFSYIRERPYVITFIDDEDN